MRQDDDEDRKRCRSQRRKARGCIFQAGRCVGFIVHRGLNYEATDSTGTISLGLYPRQRDAAAALQVLASQATPNDGVETDEDFA
jgi:hypothetical protein